VLIIDDLLTLPVKLSEVILNVLVQTAYKSAWAEYRRQLNIALIRLRRDFEQGKLKRNKMRKLESNIFREMRVARRILESKD
jgi:hypothetical protein